MSLSLNEIQKKKVKSKTAPRETKKASHSDQSDQSDQSEAQTKKRVTRPWEEIKMTTQTHTETETDTQSHAAGEARPETPAEARAGAQNQSDENTDHTNTEKAGGAGFAFANKLACQLLRKSFQYKDKITHSPQWQKGLSLAHEKWQEFIDKNPAVHRILNKIESHYKVSEKINQVVTLANLIESELRQKL